MRPLAIASVVMLVLTGSAWGQGEGDDRREIGQKIDRLHEKIGEARRRETVLTSEISAVTAKIRTLEDAVSRASGQLLKLQAELAVHEVRLAELTALLDLQTRKLVRLRTEHVVAQRRLEKRLVEVYESHSPSAMEVVLTAASFSELLDQLDYLNEIGEQDRSIVDQVSSAKTQMRTLRERTGRLRRDVARTTRAIEQRTKRQRAERDRLLRNQQALGTARSEKRETLASIQEDEREFLHEVEGLERTSAALAASIRSAQAATPVATVSHSAVSASGFIWPVAGPVTSGFGWRWGRMHEGIDISAGSGTPIHAAASGTVIHAGWMGGYGNLVAIAHSGSVSTAYAHQSSIAVSVGQAVSQGQTIGYVGCTGHCYGSHLHFEVRVNGSAVDPLGYL